MLYDVSNVNYRNAHLLRVSWFHESVGNRAFDEAELNWLYCFILELYVQECI